MSSIIGYKWIQDNWESSRGNETPWKMGVWKEIDGEIKLCSHGYHACRSIYQSLGYIYGNRLVMIEAEGIQEETDKFVAQRMRVVSEIPSNEIMIEFAIACTKNVLYLYEKQYPDDDRPRKAIDAADAARAAANTAAAAAACATDCAVVYAAACAADAAAAANTAAAAAYAAADAAAACAAAAAAAARNHEIEWQKRKLEQISNKYIEMRH
jgi:hypothetical protein